MEKLFNPYDKEYMKMAMLKHEETFREQVYELHRLYQIQKLLMKNIANSPKHEQESDRRNFKITTKSNQANVYHQDIHKMPRKLCLDLELPAEEFVPGTECNNQVQIDDDEYELELTLGIGPKSNNGRRRRKALDTSLPSDSAASFSSSSTGSSRVIKRASSGSYHQRTNEIREEQLIGGKWTLDLPSSNPNVLVGRQTSSDIEEQLRQDRLNNSPWLLQVLSLNTT
ncbi:hypothetical protein ACH5RR_011520 [Cinchona calisaya]|uniref:Uncharacterized protein n=1 Tax=Cinchona calisaya TaxID=153742 RepID=A0ABD3A6K2_9GENT